MDAFADTGGAPGGRFLRMVRVGRIGNRWLIVAQIGLVLLALVVVAIPIAGIPLLFSQLRTLCATATTCSDTGQLTPQSLRLLEDLGLSLEAYAKLSVGVPAAAAAVWISASMLVVWRRPTDPIALLTGSFLLTGSVGVADGPLRDALAASNSAWGLTTAVIHTLAAVALGLLLAVFPDGRWVPRWTRWLPLGWSAYAVPHVVVPGSDTFLLPVILALVVAGAWAQIWRYRCGSDVVQRQQIKWAVFGLSTALFGWFAIQTLGSTVFADQLRLGSPWVLLYSIAIRGVWLLVPLSISVAVLHYRLWDIEPIVNRTLVYGALAALITVTYIAVVVGVGTLAGARGDRGASSSGGTLGLSLLATAAVAVAFQPLHERLQRVANRLVYGQRASPYEVLANFSRRVAGALSVDQVLPGMAEVAAHGVGARRSRVRVYVPGGPDRAVAWPAEAINQEFERTVAVLYQSTPVGEISVNKGPGDPLTPVESELLADLASQAGLALSNVRLALELEARLEQLAVQADELRASRQRIVAAQDDERRRLERDIHDGAQQQLVAIAVNARLARRVLGTTQTPAAGLLDEISVQVEDALDNLRNLARGVFPAILADRGLVPALRAHVARNSARVRVEAASSVATARFAAPIETAVYFCCLEALQNAAKHAADAPVTIRIAAEDGWLEFSARDEGPGFDLATVVRGTGLHSMADRLAALYGVLSIDSAPGGPTVVAGRVPFRHTQPSSQDERVADAQTARSRSDPNSDLGT
jgi:signal transduction histidine kinase